MILFLQMKHGHPLRIPILKEMKRQQKDLLMIIHWQIQNDMRFI